MTDTKQSQQFHVGEYVLIQGKDHVYRIGAIHRVMLEYWYQLVEMPDFLIRQSRLTKKGDS